MTNNLNSPQSELIKRASEPESWQDPKRKLWLLSPMAPVIGWGMYLAVKDQTGFDAKNTVIAWVGSIFTYGFIPLADYLMGLDKSNLSEQAYQQLEKDDYYQKIAHAFIPLNYIALFISSRRKTTHFRGWI